MERDDAPDVLADLASDPLFRGIRPSPMTMPDPRWILGETQQKALRTLCELDLVFDALVWPSQLDGLNQALLRHPDLGCVINHFGYPDVASGDLGGLERRHGATGGRYQSACEVLPVFSWVSVTPAATTTFRPLCDHLLECFGAGRIMWGSDWPHLLADSDYPSWYDRSHRLLEGASPGDLADIFGASAARLYGI